MRRAVAIIAIAILASCDQFRDEPVADKRRAAPELVADARERVSKGVERIRKFMLDGKMVEVINQMPADLIPGGARAKKMALAQAEKMNSDVLEIAKGMVMDAPTEIRRVGHRHVCVVPYSSTIQDKNIKACQIAISTDGGRSWQFLSGSANAVKGLQKTAPDLVMAIANDIQKMEVINKRP